MRKWSDYDYQRAVVFHEADNGGGGITAEDIEESIRKRREGKDMSDFILDHTPQYWTSRTREQVQGEGYNADHVAEELAKQGLTLAGATPPPPVDPSIEETVGG